MTTNIINLIKLFLSNNSLLRILQIYNCLNIKLYGTNLEFGAIENKNKTFSNFFTGRAKFEYTNIIANKKLNIFYSDLTKKLKIKKNKYNNVLIFNVLEHLPKYNLAFSETYKILKKGGCLIGSTPFLYQIHSAPHDYFRYTKDFLNLNLKKNKFRNIKIVSLGKGPFIASYSLIHPYLKFLPLFSQIILFVRTNLSEIFPIGYLFIGKK